MSPRRVSVGLAIVILFLIAANTVIRHVSSPAENIKPFPKSADKVPSVTETAQVKVSALGRIAPKDGIVRVTAPIGNDAMRLEQLLVREGESVKQGQVLAILGDHSIKQAELKVAASEVAAARIRLSKVLAGAKKGDLGAQQAEIAGLQAELEMIAADYERFSKLYAKNLISLSSFDNIRTKKKHLEEQLHKAKLILDSVAEIRPVDIDVAQAELDIAAARLKMAQVGLENASIKSPKDGRILKVNVWPGEQLPHDSKGVLELGQTGQMFVVAEVYESDIGRIRMGQHATVRSPSLPVELTGEVSEIGWQIRKKDVMNTDPIAEVDARVVEVKICLSPESSRLVEGLTNLQVNVVFDAGK